MKLKYPLLLLPNNYIDVNKYKKYGNYINLSITHENNFVYIGNVCMKFVEPNADVTSCLTEIQNAHSPYVDNSEDNSFSEYSYGQKLFSTIVESPDPELYRFEDVEDLDPITLPNHTNETIKHDWQDNTALAQLLSSPDDRETPKQRKTIIFSGSDATHGQTIQKINMHDPSVQCRSVEGGQAEINFAGRSTLTKNPTSAKKYQCESCQQIFDDISSFKQHIVTKHRTLRNRLKSQTDDIDEQKPTTADIEMAQECVPCKKTFRTQDKYLIHLEGHGNPDRECLICRRVLSSKSSLKNHNKTHSRRHPCTYCTKSFNRKNAMETHVNRTHKDNTCYICNENCNNLTELGDHVNLHKQDTTIPDHTFEYLLQEPPTAGDLNDVFSLEDLMEVESEEVVETNKGSEMIEPTLISKYVMEYDDNFDLLTFDNDIQGVDCNKFDTTCTMESAHAYNLGDAVADDCLDTFDGMNAADILNSLGSVSAIDDNSPTLSNLTQASDLTQSNDKYNTKKYSKVCMICGKGFDRKSDLKRHTIEHVVKKALSRNPVNTDGQLNLECDVCHSQPYTEVDKFKAHLRTHANLTIYECKFCDKSFSDSSNFSKHKKVHSKSYFQCDLCNRKFNSKSMIAKHMDYHDKTPPFVCPNCSKVCHFESTFKRHMRSNHARSPRSKYRCKVCDNAFVSLRQKWDHEWNTHKIRKTVVDCKLCPSKFRKFTDLKRHSNVAHNVAIPNSKNYFSAVHFDFKEKIEFD